MRRLLLAACLLALVEGSVVGRQPYPAERPVKVTFLGDVMCQGPMLKAYSTGDGKYDFSEVFAGVKGLLAESDYVFANLETPIAPDNQDLTQERYSFCSPHEFAEAAKAAGIDFVFTANNHCLDRGPAGIPRTVAALNKIGLPHTGTFATAQDAAKPIVVDVKGFKIGVLSYTYGSNAFANHQYLSETNRFMVNLFQEQELSNPLARAWMRNSKSKEGLRYVEYEKKNRPENLTLPVYERQEPHERERKELAADVARMKAEKPDFIAMSMHAGGQYNPAATKYTKELAEFIRGCGVDFISGTHEHVVHGGDFSKFGESKLTTYSLGNFNSLNGVWEEPYDKLADYSIAWHLYLGRKGDGKPYVAKTTFSVLKTIRDGEDNRIRVVPVADYYIRQTDHAVRQKLRADLITVAKRFCGTDFDRLGVCAEYPIAETAGFTVDKDMPGGGCGATALPSLSGVYPHLAMFNDEGECGTGAVVPWAGDLWVVTYGPHCPLGSSDKLYRIKPDLTRETFVGSVGGTHANRMIHRETNQLLIGPYVIDAKGNVRVIPPLKMPGRLTANARHLAEPGCKAYYATMEAGLFEVDLQTLDVNTLIQDDGVNKALFEKTFKAGNAPKGWYAAPVPKLPGYHGKGMMNGFGKLFYANNGEHSKEAKSNPFIPAGALGSWSAPGEDWKLVRRCQFTEVTSPDGIYGNEHPQANPVWTLGWDAKSVILGVTTNGSEWTYYRLPKASHCYDGAHGWNTEWPRIRDVGFEDGALLATMHGTFWRFPRDFSPANPNGIRPISTYLKVIADFCRWGDRIVFGCDDQAKSEFLGKRGLKKDAPRCKRSQSNLWFVEPERLKMFGPPSGEGYVWLNEDVKAGEVSEPYLHAGYESMRFSFTRADGSPVRHELVQEGDWVRVKCLEDVKGAVARFRYGPAKCATPPLDKAKPVIEVADDNGKVWRFPNVNGDTNVVCREIATERDLLYAGGVWYEVPAENAGGFAALRPIALADEPVKTLRGERGLMYLNEKPMVIDDLWANGTAPVAYWLWEERR